MRILILTSSTGGGHNMRASSFVHWTRKLAPATADDIQVHKCLENTHGLYRFGVGLYNRIQRYAPWAHHVYFNFLEVAAPCYSQRWLLGAARFRAILDHVRPQVILSTHGSLNHGFFDLARSHLGADRVRCVTYCGEMFGKYGFSRHWVNPEADLFIGAVPETCAMARVLGMPAERTQVGGFLLNPSFYQPPLTREERAAFLRDRLGLDPDRFTLLLSTGEHGAHNHMAFLDSLEAARPRLDLQVIALCGRHPESLARVEAWAQKHPAIPCKALPHSSEMHLLMQCVVRDCGASGDGDDERGNHQRMPDDFQRVGRFHAAGVDHDALRAPARHRRGRPLGRRIGEDVVALGRRTRAVGHLAPPDRRGSSGGAPARYSGNGGPREADAAVRRRVDQGQDPGEARPGSLDGRRGDGMAVLRTSNDG